MFNDAATFVVLEMARGVHKEYKGTDIPPKFWT